MIHKILVALDRSDEISRYVFQKALDLAKATGASMKLVHVLSVDDKGSPNILNLFNTPANKKRWEEFEKPGRELLLSLTTQATAAGVPTEHYQGLGKPGHVICDTAQAWEADVIVMGRRGLSGLNEMIMGSVSNYVNHYAPCSVLIVQGETPSNPESLQESHMPTPA
jgi:nucleotide-binding universal stress UspA family protein